MYPEQKSLIENVPDISEGKNKCLLYIGASKHRIFLYDVLLNFGYKIDIIEIFDENIKYLKKFYENVIQGDVREIDKIISKFYDVIVWWHGPEHIEKEKLESTLKKLENISNLVILGCPTNEKVCQKTIYNNIYEKHLSKIIPSDFEKLGYKTHVVSREPNCNHITAWKVKNDF